MEQILSRTQRRIFLALMRERDGIAQAANAEIAEINSVLNELRDDWARAAEIQADSGRLEFHELPTGEIALVFVPEREAETE